MNKKVSVILPVYKGGKYFKECLDSLSKNLTFFYCIYISINKSDFFYEDIEIAREFINNNKKSQIFLYIQQKSLTAIEHSEIFYPKILQDDVNTDYFLFLCHDDKLADSFSDEIVGLDKSLSTDIIINPTKTFYKDFFSKDNIIGTYHGLRSYRDLRISKEKFAMQCYDCLPDTNISGVILSRNAFVEWNKITHLFSYGYRAEYILLFLNSVHYVQGTRKPLVYIRCHDGSEGSRSFKKLMIKDEQLYRIYCLYNVCKTEYLDYFYNKLSFTYILHSLWCNYHCYKLVKNRKVFFLVLHVILKDVLAKFKCFVKRILKFLLSITGLSEFSKKCRKSNL